MDFGGHFGSDVAAGEVVGVDVDVEFHDRGARFRGLIDVRLACSRRSDGPLTGMPTPTTLHIAGCKSVTEAGVRKLKAALPKCKIESDFPDIASPK